MTARWWIISRESPQPANHSVNYWSTTLCDYIGTLNTKYMALHKPYLDIPGTTVFDADQARAGYHLNSFCMSLMKPDHRMRFKSAERAYLDEWPMSEAQKVAVLARDFNAMIALGGNIYFLAKIFSCDGHSFQHAAATMTGMSQADYAKMMRSGGRSPDGNRYVGERH